MTMPMFPVPPRMPPPRMIEGSIGRPTAADLARLSRRIEAEAESTLEFNVQAVRAFTGLTTFAGRVIERLEAIEARLEAHGISIADLNLPPLDLPVRLDLGTDDADREGDPE